MGWGVQAAWSPDPPPPWPRAPEAIQTSFLVSPALATSTSFQGTELEGFLFAGEEL